MEKIIIAAMARNRVIGRDNKLPWHIPEELRLFKETTMGFPMIMGRRTFDSLGSPLPGRRHLILSRNPEYRPQGGERASSLQQAFELCGGSDKVYIIGGAQIFQLALPLADTLRLTLLEREVTGDVFFPEFAGDDFRLCETKAYLDSAEPFTVATYRRKN